MIRSKLCLIAGVVGILVISWLDMGNLRPSLIHEGRPQPDAVSIFRSIFLLIPCSMVVWGLVSVRTHGRESKFSVMSMSSANLIVVYGFVLLACSILALYTYDHFLFDLYSREDYWIENLSALFAGLGGMILGYLAVFGGRQNLRTVQKVWICFLAVLMMLIALEEISWFQRVFNFDPPSVFHKNLQFEMNFHNFFTNQSENFYYFGTFVFLVVLPFWAALGSRNGTITHFELPVPGFHIGVMCVLIAGFNYDMWDVVFTQVAFFTSLGVLICYIASTQGREKIVCIVVLIMTIGVQTIFLVDPIDVGLRTYAVTEYKEFLISLGLFLFAVDIVARKSNKKLILQNY